MAYKADCAIILALLKIALLGKVMIRDWVHGMGHSPVCRLIANFMQGTYHGISSCLYQLFWDIVYPWRFSLLERFHSCFDLLRQDWVVVSVGKKAYQLVKTITSTKQGKTNTIQDKDGNCLTETNDILNRWTEYCGELYSRTVVGDPEVLTIPQVAIVLPDVIFNVLTLCINSSLQGTVYDLQIKNAHAYWMPKYAQNEGLLAPISFKSVVIQPENTGKY